MALDLDDCAGFDWDDGNSGKNWHGHRMTDRECEEVFDNAPIIIVRDKGHSNTELRYAARGVTDLGRRVTVVFTIRHRLIRVISARDMTRQGERFYEEKVKRNS